MLLVQRYLLHCTKSGKGIAEKNALLALQRISTASSIDQILTIISASATNIDTNIENQELDKDKIIRSAVENTYSLSVQAIRAAYRSYSLWSVLSFALKYMNRIGLNLNSKFQDANYVLTTEHGMGYIWSETLRERLEESYQDAVRS